MCAAHSHSFKYIRTKHLAFKCSWNPQKGVPLTMACHPASASIHVFTIHQACTHWLQQLKPLLLIEHSTGCIICRASTSESKPAHADSKNDYPFTALSAVRHPTLSPLQASSTTLKAERMMMTPRAVPSSLLTPPISMRASRGHKAAAQRVSATVAGCVASLINQNLQQSQANGAHCILPCPLFQSIAFGMQSRRETTIPQFAMHL